MICKGFVGLSVIIAVLCGCNRLHTVEELGNVRHSPASHKGYERYSRLESMYDYMQVIGQDVLRTGKMAVYPRIKRMSDGRYLMLCQEGRIASRIFYYISDDLKNWSLQGELFSPYPVSNAAGDDVRCFTTADAAVLAGGEIIVVCSYRASKGYRQGVDCGLMMRTSSDCAATWSEEEVIFEGTNWEPYLLQLPDGRVQCYFTDCNPSTRNSGTSVMVSDDGGETWGRHIRCSRQFKYVDKGVNIYTDQMPSFRVLADNRTIAGFLEARLEPDGPQGKSRFMMSMVYNDGFDWKDLGENAEGPERRKTNVLAGCAGYVSVFPSGEVLLSSNIGQMFSMKLGNASATVFNGNSWEEDWFRPFCQKGYWGATEVVEAHKVVGAMHCEEGIQFGQFYLNHAVNVEKRRIRTDGRTGDWDGHDDALYLGSDGNVSAVFRASRDENNLYMLVECLCDDVDAGIELMFGTGSGIKSVMLDKTAGITGTSADGRIRRACTADGRKGYTAEFSIPLSSLCPLDTSLMFNAYINYGETADGFTGADKTDISTWLPLLL